MKDFLLNLFKAKELTSPPAHRAIALSANGEYLLNGSTDQTAFVQIEGEQHSLTMPPYIPENPYAPPSIEALQIGQQAHVAFSPDGHFLITALRANRADIWRTDTQQRQRKLTHENLNICAILTDEHTHALLMSRNGDVWDALHGNKLFNLNGYLTQEIEMAALSHDGESLATVDDQHHINFWHAYNGEYLRSLARHKHPITAIEFSVDGVHFASASSDKIARIWHIVGDLMFELKGHRKAILDLCYAPDGRWLATASADHSIRLWDVRTGKCNQTLNGFEHAMQQIIAHPDGDKLCCIDTQQQFHTLQLN
jgi:WD40 repeat protein